ncbi:hypothetical protein GLOIN_2v1769754 [Rhizophagus irregularis DAOM 181602=DAOM 197198]|nr:hypothetical protein GLOIN_2v1769754 [Rhizophagus irregularis DAOM 181602=DAOM 197198]
MAQLILAQARIFFSSQAEPDCGSAQAGSCEALFCSDCGKPTASACRRCPMHIRGYYVAKYYKKLKDKAKPSRSANMKELGQFFR